MFERVVIVNFFCNTSAVLFEFESFFNGVRSPYVNVDGFDYTKRMNISESLLAEWA